uniref:protein FAM47E isoform X2 n=1 Tax=Jaculus jaculus TaxID=51337 RepID=UPI001E1B5641|nr:protein FAM47E isoform X2 [Jaculus jaculus]
MADRGRRFQPGTLARMPELRNCGPGYRQNQPFKAFTKHNRMKFPGCLNSQRWVFVREELGDFRKGCQLSQSLVAQGPKEAILPQIHDKGPRPGPEKRQDKLPKEAAWWSKPSAAQRVQNAFPKDVEAQLALHPFTLYPHLEEALLPELLLKVLKVLDPERKLEDTWAYCQDDRKIMESMQLLEKSPTLSCLRLKKKIPVSHSGKWLYEKKPNGMDLLHKDSPPLHENMRKGVSDFCKWATAIGSSYIDEEFICKQFDIDYQSRQSCGVLHVMRLNHVPLELKNGVRLNKLQEAEFFQKLDRERKLQKPQNPHKPKWVKMRYGAWYLNTSLWKKQRADEPLVDSKVSCKAQEENFKKELQKKEELLANLHGTAAFKDFILSRGNRIPRFLEKIYAEKRGQSEYRKPLGNLGQA